MSIGRLSQLDSRTLARIQAGCNFINHEIARLRNRVIFIVALALAGFGALWMFYPGIDPRIPIIGALGVSIFVAGRAQRELAKTYKSIVIRRVVDALGKGLAYQHESGFTKAQFVAMDLFTQRLDVFKSEDQVSARRNAVAYSLHEVRAARRERRGKHTQEIVFFRGLILELDFNKNFAGHTIVVPDSDGRILGGLLGEREQRKNKSIVRFENVDFENVFSVYSTDDQEAHYLLTPKLMELVLQARAVLAADLRLCFHRNSLFVTIPSQRDRFEVGFFSHVTPEYAISDLVEVVSLAERLVEILDLETRIWTRV